MRVVLTIVGKDKVGITAKVSNALAEMNIKDRKSTRLNSSHITRSRMPSSA